MMKYVCIILCNIRIYEKAVVRRSINVCSIQWIRTEIKIVQRFRS
jgi:hypothetical protein